MVRRKRRIRAIPKRFKKILKGVKRKKGEGRSQEKETRREESGKSCQRQEIPSKVQKKNRKYD